MKRLREELDEKGFRLEFHKNGELVNIQKAYEALYDLSKLTKAEQNILEAFSLFPYIPLSAEVCNQWLLEDADVSEEDDILMGLYQKGWLQFDVEQESYALHPVFAQFIYENICTEVDGRITMPNVKKHIGLVVACLESLENLATPINGLFSGCQKYISIAENIIEKMDMEESIGEYKIISIIIRLLLNIRNYERAGKWCKIALKICKDSWGENHPETINNYNNLGVAYKFLGEYSNAKVCFETCIALLERTLGINHLATAIVYHNLAEVYEDQGEYVKAEELYIKSIRILEREPEENNLHIAKACGNLAGLYKKQRIYEKSEELYIRSIKLLEKMFGECHLDVIVKYDGLADLYEEQGEYKKAEKLYIKNVKIWEEIVEENHSEIVNTYNKLAKVYLCEKEYKKAGELYIKSTTVLEKVLGEGHLKTASGYNNLAVTYLLQEEFPKALAAFFRAFQIWHFNLGWQHQYTFIAYKHMKEAYYWYNAEGDFEQWLEEKMKE